MRNFWLYRFPAAFWMAVIYGLSSIPRAKLDPINFPCAHLTAHVIEYGVLGLLLIRSFLNSLGGDKWFFSVFTALLISAFFAGTDEWHQTFVAGRHGELTMVGGDILFAICGVGLYLYLKKYTVNRTSKAWQLL